MTAFEQLDPKLLGELGDGMIAGWGIASPEPVIVAVMGYMFGQYRIQCWYQSGQGWPWILSPEC